MNLTTHQSTHAFTLSKGQLIALLVLWLIAGMSVCAATFAPDIKHWQIYHQIQEHSKLQIKVTDKTVDRAFNELISKHEGFRHRAYHDLGGGCSIGYGTPCKGRKWISKKQAERETKRKIRAIQKRLVERFDYITENELIAMTDVVYNVRTKNLPYIFEQFSIRDETLRKNELTYALRRMACAWNPQRTRCIRYKGLVKRFNDRVALFFAPHS